MERDKTTSYERNLNEIVLLLFFIGKKRREKLELLYKLDRTSTIFF